MPSAPCFIPAIPSTSIRIIGRHSSSIPARSVVFAPSVESEGFCLANPITRNGVDEDVSQFGGLCDHHSGNLLLRGGAAVTRRSAHLLVTGDELLLGAVEQHAQIVTAHAQFAANLVFISLLEENRPQ